MGSKAILERNEKTSEIVREFDRRYAEVEAELQKIEAKLRITDGNNMEYVELALEHNRIREQGLDDLKKIQSELENI